MVIEVDPRMRYKARLKNLYFRLYETEKDLSSNKNSKDVMDVDAYDYVESLILRKKELVEKIEELLFGTEVSNGD